MNTDLKPNRFKNILCGRIRMLFVVDEAKTLVELQYYNSFRWVLDNVIQRAWEHGHTQLSHPLPLPFLAIFLGTNSKVADFLPPGKESSYRYFASTMKVPQPFTALDWDVHVSEPYIWPDSSGNSLSAFGNVIRADEKTETKLMHYQLQTMGWLSRFGRPMWYARWASKSNSSIELKHDEAERIIKFAEEKLCHLDDSSVEEFLSHLTNYISKLRRGRKPKEDFIQACSAILAVLVGLDFDFTSPSRAADLVASRLRWAVASDASRTYFLTTYPSEPILAEAASRIFFSAIMGASKPAYHGILQVVADEITQGNYDFGSDGELAAKILCKRAFDEVADGKTRPNGKI